MVWSRLVAAVALLLVVALAAGAAVSLVGTLTAASTFQAAALVTILLVVLLVAGATYLGTRDVTTATRYW